jgi:2-methylcitrate dehydratase PrpD
MMGLTTTLAQFVCDTQFDDLPETAVNKARECFLDWQGVALAASNDPAAEIIKKYVEIVRGNPEANVIGSSIKTDMANAALANGLIGHALDFDDYHDETVIHASAACVPAILAVAEKYCRSGRDFLTAMVLGIDVCIRVGLGLGDYHYQRGWHTTGTAGTFGATAGAAKLLGLNADQLVNAFGICGTQASGLRQVFGTMCKPFHAGKVSREGVLSALLSLMGFTSSGSMIEGELGLFDVLTEYPNEDVVMDGLGQEYYINHLSIKPYPT